MELLGLALALFGAALAGGLAGVGSAIGVGIAGESAAGVMSEDPDKFVKCLMLQALPGTQGFYGFIIVFMVMTKLNMFGTPLVVSWLQGLMVFAACMPVALACWFSAISQGKASAAAIQMISKKPDAVGKALVLPAMVETYAVLSLLTSILLLMFGVQLG
ncbi:MAG: V-type ATP synthase subunit K [Synergistaceae bacterium]|jgi:V/A-type H+-transporting ATPase subunit K|nr:V-type ATP synthase subunit K [Synergistaceae bacterium]